MENWFSRDEFITKLIAIMIMAGTAAHINDTWRHGRQDPKTKIKTPDQKNGPMAPMTAEYLEWMVRKESIS